MSDEISIEVPAHEDWDAFYQTNTAAFNADGDEDTSAAERLLFEPERCLVARRDGEIVGTAGISTRQLSVPGAVVPAAHVTLVAVAPTARRRGVLTRFIGQQFADMRAAGEPIAALWASEGRIYQRFGYGLAARKLSLTVETREINFTAPVPAEGRLREGLPTDLRDMMIKVYDEVYAQRPGWSERAARHWDHRLADPDAWRRGFSGRRAVVHEGEHGVDGYALWRVTNNWTDAGPAGEVRVMEHVATTPAAYAALWRFLLTVDLTRTATHWFCSVDEPLLFMVDEPRRLGSRLGDALWVRIVDLGAALSARRYQADVDVVFEVTDELIPANAGRWRLTASSQTAKCVSTADSPDLACDIGALGAAYLGGTSLIALADGGLLRELRPGALSAAAVAMGWYRSPSSIEVF